MNAAEQDGVWAEISAEIEVNEVWKDILIDLDNLMPYYPGSGIIVKSVAAVLIFLSGMVPVQKSLPDSNTWNPDIRVNDPVNASAFFSVNDDIVELPALEAGKNNGLATGSENLSVNNVSKSIITERRNRNDLIPEASMALNFESLSDATTGYGSGNNNELVADYKLFSEMQGILSKSITEKSINLKVLPGSKYGSLQKNMNSGSANKFHQIGSAKISGGLITLFKNTWLLNYETYDGLRSESLNTTKIVFFPDAGLSLNYSFTKNWMLQADAFLFSGTGQRYQEYIAGHYSQKSIILRYSMIALSAKYRFTGVNGPVIPSSINLIAGGYLSVLYKADQKINTDLVNIGSQYRKFDAGVRLGGEFEFQLTTGFSMAPGVFMTLGIPNIYRGDNIVPGYLRRTHNGSAGFQLAFYYHF